MPKVFLSPTRIRSKSKNKAERIWPQSTCIPFIRDALQKGRLAAKIGDAFRICKGPARGQQLIASLIPARIACLKPRPPGPFDMDWQTNSVDPGRGGLFAFCSSAGQGKHRFQTRLNRQCLFCPPSGKNNKDFRCSVQIPTNDKIPPAAAFYMGNQSNPKLSQLFFEQSKIFAPGGDFTCRATTILHR